MTHEWQAALLMRITDDEARGIWKNERTVVDEDRLVEVADVFCRRCLTRYIHSEDPCISISEQIDHFIAEQRQQASRERQAMGRAEGARKIRRRH